MVAGSLVLVALGGLALAATLQNRTEERASAREILAVWRDVGSSLVHPALYSDMADTGLECFGYRTPALESAQLCFDSQRRLVQAIRETAAKATLASVLLNPGQAPVRVSASALAAARKAAALNFGIGELRTAVGLCELAISAGHRGLASGTHSERHAYDLLIVIRASCRSAAEAARLLAPAAVSTRASSLLSRLTTLGDTVQLEATNVAKERSDLFVAAARVFTTRALRARSAITIAMSQLDAQHLRDLRRLARS
jgi:hypothetical protein